MLLSSHADLMASPGCASDLKQLATLGLLHGERLLQQADQYWADRLGRTLLRSTNESSHWAAVGLAAHVQTAALDPC